MMYRIGKGVLTAFAAAVLVWVASPGVAHAADNDFVLSRYATFQTPPNADQCEFACGTADPNVKLFESLVHDFGQVIGPKFIAPAETLGEAGFAFNIVPNVAFIPAEEEHWDAREGVQWSKRDSQEGSSALFVPGLVVRKGLPFSFEIAGTMQHVAGSDMFTVGTQIKWALNEGFYAFPDVAVRGTVNTLVGSKDLQMITTGWDVSVSKAFPIAGVMSINPYAGYQQLHVWGWSRLLNVRPQDPRAPQKDPATGDNVDESFNPEFVFSTHHEAINRFFVGTRLNVHLVSFVLEGIIGESVYQMTASVGMDF